VTPISTATKLRGRPIRVGSQPWYLAVTPNGKTVYVPNENSGTVTPIATNTPGPQSMSDTAPGHRHHALTCSLNAVAPGQP
jgi:DNA-binding beta-propeller fold protein YncE